MRFTSQPTLDVQVNRMETPAVVSNPGIHSEWRVSPLVRNPEARDAEAQSESR